VGTKNKMALATCTICGQQIPVNELQEHMRIELLDPRWKSQRDALEARKAQASELQRGANVVSSLKNLARTRVDIFGTETDEERRKREEEEERERRKEREKVVWDGHTATKAGTLDKYSTNVNFDEQIAAIHRAKGLGPYVTSSLSDELTVTKIVFTDKIRTQLAQALVPQRHRHLLPLHHPHTLSQQNQSMWCLKTPRILLQRYRRDHSLRQCTLHLPRLLCFLRSTIRD
jgi:hypothetical protein